MDFHAEALVYLSRLGYRIGESPITVNERAHGTSMYSLVSAFTYPASTALMTGLAIVHAALSRRARST